VSNHEEKLWDNASKEMARHRENGGRGGRKASKHSTKKRTYQAYGNATTPQGRHSARPVPSSTIYQNG